jgi:hypothetical protein
MKTPILILISAFLTVACSNQPATNTPAGTPANPVVTSFSESEKDTLDVQVTDRQPVTQAELTSPDGKVFIAHQIDRERLTRYGGSYGPTVGVGVGGGSWNGGGFGVGTGVGFGFPLGGGGSYDGPRDGGVASTARIRVPDMAAYRAHWQQWKVRVTLGEGAAKRVIEVGAPPPPAAG